MAHRTSGTSRTLALALLLLAASPESTRAGFVWLAPDGSNQTGSTVPTDSGNGAAAPDSGTVAMPLSTPTPEPATSPAPVPLPPVGSAETSPPPALVPSSAPVTDGAPAFSQTSQGSSVTLADGVVMGTPVYARGDQTSPPVVRPTTLESRATSDGLSGSGVLSPLTGSVVAGGTMGTPPISQTASEQPVTLSPLPPSPAAAPNRLSPLTGQDVTPSLPAAATSETASIPPEVVSPSSTPNASSGSEPIAEGFGKQVPLIIALRQILPATHGFAHRDGVDLTRSVNWQGGRPWPQVLADALSPLGLRAQISGDTVLIERLDDRGATSAAGSSATPVLLTPSPTSRIPSAASPLPSAPASATEAQELIPAQAMPIPASTSQAAAPGSVKLGQGTVIQSPSSN